jgi:Tfp pilus assembly protein FimV
MRSIERMYEEDIPMTTLSTLTPQADLNPQTTARPTSPIRLTRRGRLIVVLSVMALMVFAGIVSGHGSSQAAGRGSLAATSRTLTVQPGETLWSVAARIAPHSDPRLVVADIESRNHLLGDQVLAGQQLRVPRIG